MDTIKNLQKARAKLAENRASGIKPSNPIEKAKQNSKSRVLAITAFCYDCMGRESGWRNMVKTCTSPDCPLFRLRPHK
jgi:hypothetical protein